MSPRRPRCFLNVAVSLDGKISSFDRGRPTFPSREDRRRMDLIRARADAVLIGAATLRATDFPLRIRSSALRKRRLAQGRPEQPLNILLSSTLRVPLKGRFFTDQDTKRLVFTTPRARKKALETARQVAEILVWRGKSINLRRLMVELYRRGIRELLLEGGGATNFDFFRLGLVDEIYMTLCPVVIGGEKSPTSADGAGFRSSQFLRYAPASIQRTADEIFLHYLRS
jgi:2,5-diamino-6-(ribosylamino)-4(3H)-pyrimidinone 5'-phosphate reductase